MKKAGPLKLFGIVLFWFAAIGHYVAFSHGASWGTPQFHDLLSPWIDFGLDIACLTAAAVYLIKEA
jgi:hypothetical protein